MTLPGSEGKRNEIHSPTPGLHTTIGILFFLVFTFCKIIVLFQVLQFRFQPRLARSQFSDFSSQKLAVSIRSSYSGSMAIDTDCNTVETMVASYASDENFDVGDFECNICFELAQDPIVTLCGHLYCWPCLYQWLQVHSYSHECPVCKALVQEEKLVPIYGRGKVSSDQRSQYVPGINVPNRPVGQRPQTVPPIDVNYFQPEELDPVASPRFGSLTLSAIFSILPTIFSFQVNGIHDATVYGATTGVPHLFSGSFHGGYTHGFYHHSAHIDGKQFFMAIFFLFLGVCIVGYLVLW